MRKKGDLIFLADFVGKGTQTAVRVALSRLSRGEVKKTDTGHLLYATERSAFWAIYPAAGEVAEPVVKKKRFG